MGSYIRRVSREEVHERWVVPTTWKQQLVLMGIPIYYFEEFEPDDVVKFEWCSEGFKARLGELWEHRVRIGGETRVMDEDMVYAWRFDLQRRVESRLINLAELESARSKDASSWVFYKADGSEMAVYRHSEEQLEVLTGVQEVLQGARITSVDVQGGTLVLGLDNGQIKAVTCDSHGRLLECETVVVGGGDVLDVFGGLWPEFIVSFGSEQGLLCTEMASGETTKLLDVPTARLERVALDFPRLSVCNASQLWACDNVLQSDLCELEAPLRPGETIVNAEPCAGRTLLLETSQRYVSVTASEARSASSASSTILHKTECGLRTATSGHQLFVSEQHLYATSLAVYAPLGASHRWLSLGYSDIRAKYSVSKVLRLTLLAAGDPATSLLALLADDGSIHSFSVER